MEFEDNIELLLMDLSRVLSESMATNREKTIALQEVLDDYLVLVHNEKVDRLVKRECPYNGV